MSFSNKMKSAWLENPKTALYCSKVPYASMGNSLVTNWKEDVSHTCFFGVKKELRPSISSQCFLHEFTTNISSDDEKKSHKRGHFKLTIFTDSFLLAQLGLDSSILIVHVEYKKEAFILKNLVLREQGSIEITLWLYGSFVKKWQIKWKIPSNVTIIQFMEEKWSRDTLLTFQDL